MEWKRQIYLQTGHGITEARNHHNTGPRSSVFLVRVAFIAEPKTWVNTYIYSCYFITQVLCWRVEPFSSFGYASVFLNTRTSIHCQQRSKLYWLEFCFITGNERTIILILRWPKSIGWGLKLCYAFIFLFCVKDGYNLKVIWLNNNNDWTIRGGVTVLLGYTVVYVWLDCYSSYISFVGYSIDVRCKWHCWHLQLPLLTA